MVAAFALGGVWASTAKAAQVYFGSFSGPTHANISGTLPGFVGTPPGFGKVDLFQSGDGGVTCGVGRASCLSMESSDGHYGQITTIDPAHGPGQPTVLVAAGSTVTVSFEASGNQRTESTTNPDLLNLDLFFFGGLFDTGPVTLGGAWSDVFAPPAPVSGVAAGAYIAADSPFQVYTMSFVAPQNMGLSAALKSGRIGNFWTGADGFGPIVDYVAIDVTAPSAAPEPATWALMLAGFGGLGVMARRRRSALA